MTRLRTETACPKCGVPYYPAEPKCSCPSAPCAGDTSPEAESIIAAPAVIPAPNKGEALPPRMGRLQQHTAECLGPDCGWEWCTTAHKNYPRTSDAQCRKGGYDSRGDEYRCVSPEGHAPPCDERPTGGARGAPCPGEATRVKLWVMPADQCGDVGEGPRGPRGHECTMTKEHGGPVHVEIDPVFGFPTAAWVDVSRREGAPTPWTPKVGDRVRCVDDSEGTVIRIDAMVRWDDGANEVHQARVLRPCERKEPACSNTSLPSESASPSVITCSNGSESAPNAWLDRAKEFWRDWRETPIEDCRDNDCNEMLANLLQEVHDEGFDNGSSVEPATPSSGAVPMQGSDPTIEIVRFDLDARTITFRYPTEGHVRGILALDSASPFTRVTPESK